MPRNPAEGQSVPAEGEGAAGAWERVRQCAHHPSSLRISGMLVSLFGKLGPP